MSVILIVYVVLFVISAIGYLILESIKKAEILIKNKERLTDSFLAPFKLLPTALILLFSILLMPEISPFFILLSIGFFLCLIGDLTIEFSKNLSIIPYGVANLIFCIGYFIELVYNKNTILSQKVALLIVGLISLVLIIIINFLLELYLVKGENPDKVKRFRIPRLAYLISISFHLLVTIFFTTCFFSLYPGIIVSPIGAFLFFSSDNIIMIREFHHKPKFSVFKIMTTYYLGLFLISLLTIFY